MMKRVVPQFWSQRTFLSWLLYPASLLFRAMVYLSNKDRDSYKAKTPILCVGNVTVGGAGKTPTVIAIAKKMQEQGKKVVIVSKGYGGTLKGPVLVEPKHTAYEVGDEAFLLSAAAPTIIGASRRRAVQYADKQEADVIIMDDGLQNITVKKDVGVLVVDALFGIGNGMVLPAGPLRETLRSALKKAKVAIWIGNKDSNAELQQNIQKEVEIIYGTILPKEVKKKYTKPYIAFAGIGNPDKFFSTLKDNNITLVDTVPFPDHHMYTNQDINSLIEKAQKSKARLITTEKDYTKVGRQYQGDIDVFPVELQINGIEKVIERIPNKET